MRDELVRRCVERGDWKKAIESASAKHLNTHPEKVNPLRDGDTKPTGPGRRTAGLP